MNILTGTLPHSSNYKRGRNAKIKYIVIHYTANKGDTALANVKYFANNAVTASAHFFVDESCIYSSVPVSDTAYHCGGGLQTNGGHSFYKLCTNSNSIGIEMCLLDKKGNVKNNVYIKCTELVRELMKKYNIPPERVIRHWDVTGKECPKPFIGDNNAYWQDFKSRLSEEGLDMEELKRLSAKIDELGKALEQISAKQPKIYHYGAEIPVWAKSALYKAQQKGIFKGASEGDLNISEDSLKTLVYFERAGII